MNLLALDTSSQACSVALQLGDAVLARHEELPREHTRLLVPMIRSVLQESGAQLSELDAIVLGNGPGSFIGVRIAASVAQGLAYGAGLKIVPVSSMAAIAVRVLADSDCSAVVVAQDARMNEVYLGIYKRGDANLPIDMVPERLHDTGPIAELDVLAGDVRAAGVGWQRYPELLAANRDSIGRMEEFLLPRAVDLLASGAAAFRAGEIIEPQHVMPAYLRHKVAEKPKAAS
ncbi:MAG: tRNA (adenosine(37)-N6)-threonylcarbamoyltransferase complex dimerization subunit type 1 TsaB [Woeseiaceae bacterium]|nr:tRNA (adenosine(37)-N6)-threonylcarbamoyltransferase complex dimerization subunit type 1 TsaB [Woeseiaceae bacterium]